MIDPKTRKLVRGSLKHLKLGELSFVDVGANARANITIVKRADRAHAAAVAKGVAELLARVVKEEALGARTFAEVYAENEARERKWEAYRQLSPMFDSLICSVQSIAADDALSVESKMGLVRDSVQGFLDAVAETMPDVQEEITKLCKEDEALASFIAGGAGNTNEDHTMDPTKRIKELETSVADLTAKLEKANSDLKTANDAAATAKADHDKQIADLKKAAGDAGDEVIDVNGTEVRKSVVGAAMFAVVKMQQDAIEIAKYKSEAESDVYKSLPGTADDKALGLRAVAKVADPKARDAIDKMLKGGAAAMAEAMKAKGKDRTRDDTTKRGGGSDDEGGGEDDDADDLSFAEAKSELDGLVKAHQAAHKGMAYESAYTAVLMTKRGGELYEAMENARGDQAAE